VRRFIADTWAFYTGLGLVIADGLLKPNISTMVGGLYLKVIFDAIKALVFSTLVQVHCCHTMVIGFVVVKWGWHAGFGLAGIDAFRSCCLYLGQNI
jgi:POT family proton-dependent oligopeptide transporter